MDIGGSDACVEHCEWALIHGSGPDDERRSRRWLVRFAAMSFHLAIIGHQLRADGHARWTAFAFTGVMAVFGFLLL
jgi:hypothetical protein